MANCIICHLGINEGKNTFQECPNGHPAHKDCLKEWLIHSSNCPLCNETYPQNVIEKFKEYLDQKEFEKKERFENQVRKETLNNIEKITEKYAFKKFINSVEILIEQKEFDYALSRLEMHNENELSPEKKRKALFLKGKVNYMKGRYDLAINFLFKLVKDKFDYPEGFLYLGKSYEALGLTDKAKWAYERVK